MFDVLKNKILPQMKIINLDRIKPNNVKEYHPKMMMSMCLGYLKLSFLND